MAPCADFCWQPYPCDVVFAGTPLKPLPYLGGLTVFDTHRDTSKQGDPRKEEAPCRSFSTCELVAVQGHLTLLDTLLGDFVVLMVSKTSV